MSNDLLQQIKGYNKSREEAPLQLKYKVMAESPFRFFRGSCHLFYEELAKSYPFPASPSIWACGDLHIENFGSYKGSNRLVYFDLNDFDEALLAPALWEICRLLASVQIAATETGFSKKEKNKLVNTLLNSYRNTLINKKAVVIERETSRGLIKKLVTKVADRKEADLVKKRTVKTNPRKLVISERLYVLPKHEKKALISSFNKWMADNGHHRGEAIDAGFRIAGTGSIGVKRYLLLLQSNSHPQKKLLMDVKEAIPSAVSVYTGVQQPSWQNEAARIIDIQKMMQHVSPAFLSAFPYEDNWFVAKELQPMADKVNLSQTIKQPSYIENYLADLGVLTASVQLRSTGQQGSVTADELGDFAAGDAWMKILIEWAASYAEQVKQEYAIYKKAWLHGYFKK